MERSAYRFARTQAMSHSRPDELATLELLMKRLLEAAALAERVQELERRLAAVEQGRGVKLFATEQEISAEYGIGERTLRTWRTQAHTSGLAGCVVRRGRRVLYDRAAFRRWLELHRGR